jgi:hypothetical protein
MERRFWINRFGLAALLAAFVCAPALADETVSVGGSRTVLIKPKAAPRASVILLPGGDGSIRAGVTAYRCQATSSAQTAYGRRARGPVADATTDLSSAVSYMAAIKSPVTVIATSRGTIRAAEGIARGARPNALVLTSGFLSPASGGGSNVMSILGTSASLPHTLVIHHRQDSCRSTLPAGVDPFIKWSAGRARVSWVSGGKEEGDACEALGHHGFNGLDGQIVGLAAGFH